MAVISAVPSKVGTSGSVSGKGGSDGALTLTASFYVETDSPSSTSHEVLYYFFLNPSLPFNGRPFAYGNGFNTLAICDGLQVKQNLDSDNKSFTVEASYSTPSGDGKEKNDQDGNKTDDPRLWHDEIEVSSTQISVPMDQATYIGDAANEHLRPGKFQAVVNSAGESFDPTTEYELDITILRITKYGDSWDEAIAAPYRGTINNDQVNINKQPYNFKFFFGPFTAKIKEWSGTFAFENGIKYWRQTIELHINPQGWRVELLDRGLWQKVDPDDTEYVPGGEAQNNKRVVDKNGNPATTPVNFNGRGKPLADGAEPVFLTYSPYLEVPYGNINW